MPTTFLELKRSATALLDEQTIGGNVDKARAELYAILEADPGVIVDALNALEKAHKDIASGAVSETLMTTARDSGQGFYIGLEGGACGLLAECFAQQLKDSGGPNYVEMSFSSKEVLPGEQLVVRLQRVAGKTPGQLRREADAARDVAQARGDALLESLQAMCRVVGKRYEGTTAAGRGADYDEYVNACAKAEIEPVR